MDITKLTLNIRFADADKNKKISIISEAFNQKRSKGLADFLTVLYTKVNLLMENPTAKRK